MKLILSGLGILAICGLIFAGAAEAQDVVVWETPSLYKFCSRDSVDLVVEGGDITRARDLNLAKLGWTGKWRKKSLGFLSRWSRGPSLSHYTLTEIFRGGREAIGNYEITTEVYGYKTMTLKRFCIVSDDRAMNKIAADTTAAGLDDSLVPEQALVFEYELEVEEDGINSSFNTEHVFASFPGRETIGVISNFPTEFSPYAQISNDAYSPCGSRSVTGLPPKSNTDVEGRLVSVFDGSENFGTIGPSDFVSSNFRCDDYAGPCDGECPAGFTCHVRRGKNFCVNCAVFERADDDIWPNACCEVSSVTNQCKNLTGRGAEKCVVDNPDYFRVSNGKDVVLPTPQDLDTSSVCFNHRNFVRNGAACILQEGFNASGNRKCYFRYRRFSKLPRPT